MKTLRQLYQQQVRRIEKNIERMTARGYDIPDNIIPPEPKRITAGTIRRLKAITPRIIASKSMYGGYATLGEEVSGIKGYNLEKRMSAKQGARTKRDNTLKARARKARQDARIERDIRQRREYRERYDEFGRERNRTQTVQQYHGDDSASGGSGETFADAVQSAMREDQNRAEQERFERAQRARDASQREQFEHSQQYREQFSQSRITMERLEQTIRQTGQFNDVAASEMRGMLDDEINSRGMNSVLQTISENGEQLVELAQDIAEYEVGSKAYTAILNAFATLIGKVPSAEEVARWAEVSDVSDDGESYTV